VLICADIRGVESHGMHRLGSYYGSRISKGWIDPLTPFRIISETPSTALIDGGNGCGQVVSHKAMQMTLEKAKNCRHRCNYSLQQQSLRDCGLLCHDGFAADMIGISLTNSQPLVAPTFGRTAVLVPTDCHGGSLR